MRNINVSCRNSIDKQVILEFIASLLNYIKPEKYKASHYKDNRINRFSQSKFQEALINEMDYLDEDRRIKLEWENGSVSVICGKSDRALRLHFSMDDADYDNVYPELEKFICENAIMASECDAHDSYIQNQRIIHMLEWAGENPKYYPKCKGTLEDIEIDIEKNPGYQHFVSGLFIGAFYRMWFGKDSYEFIDKEALRRFKCYKNEVIDNDVTRIILYENFSEYKKKKNRDKQWEFRKKLNLDEICHRLEKEAEEEKQKNLDPSVDIKQGEFEHGGIKLVQTYLKYGENVPRSKADSVEEVEMDEHENVVFRCVRNL